MYLASNYCAGSVPKKIFFYKQHKYTSGYFKKMSKHSSTISQIVEQDLPRLFAVWESSVRATHSFLSDADICMLRPLARAEIEAFNSIYCLREIDGQPFAMLGVEGSKIEMLFIHADYFGIGAGRLLTEYAIHELQADCVDVNEQNQLAVGFYQHMGFRQSRRSPLDSSGNPFPILHLKLLNKQQVGHCITPSET